MLTNKSPSIPEGRTPKEETMLLKNLADLVKVKTIVTLVVLIVFAVLALRGSITPDDTKDIVYIVIAFYFGTQHEKPKKAITQETPEQ